MSLHPMIDDPARDLPPGACSPEADAMLQRILAVPREAAPPRRRASVRKIAIGGLGAAAAATVALAAPMPWDGGHPGTAAAYAIDRHDDGSVGIVVHWNELSDPAKLQRALHAAGAPVRILTGTASSSTVPSTAVPDCAKPYYGGPYSAAAVSWDAGRNAPDGSFVVHPAAFPTNGTLVIEVYFTPSGHRWVSSTSFMAIGRVPTCALPG